MTKLELFCQAVQNHEGYFPPCKPYPRGSKSFRNNNPANFRWTTLIQQLGAIGKDPSGFAIFADYNSGYTALKTFITMAGSNQLKAYKNCTISSFFAVYAPSYENDTLAYAKIVAKSVGMPITTKISSLI